MACGWRIRHKLMLGLGFVVCTLALLLAGTLKGLASYRATINIIDSKLVELHEAQELKAAISDLSVPADSQVDEVALLRSKIQRARVKLADYQAKLQDTLNRHRDPEGDDESFLAQRIHEGFARLEEGITQATQTGVLGMVPSSSLRNQASVERSIRQLSLATDDLQGMIYQDLYHRIDRAKSHYTSSLSLVIATTVVGVLLMAGLLRFFYQWTFSPIRDLQKGVARVAQGDFEHPIQVRSGDEMEELAAAFNDMTSRLQAMYADLAQQVNERSRQLVRSERLASVGFLAAGVAHEINNPLASIAFCSEAMERRLAELRAVLNTGGQEQAGSTKTILPFPGLRQSTAEEDWEVLAKYLKMIQEEAFRCKAITQKLLEFSRGGERRREPADLVELVQSVLDMVQHLEPSKGKQIVFQPVGKLLAWVNAQEIKSVVLNLVVNALESMDEGGTLTIRLTQREGMAEVVSTDTGCGMNGEVLENIFEPFFTRSRTGKGTGLGLSISHRVINQHGGEIEAASAGANHGSTFTVRLPLRPADPVKEDSLGHAA